MGLKMNTYGENIEDKSYAVQSATAKSRAKARQALLEAERQRQLAEEARQRRIQAYQEFNNNISNISNELVEYCNEIQEIENIVRENMTGSEADEILKNIQEVRSECETAITQLNNAGAKATGRLHAEGESNYIYVPTQIPTQKTNNATTAQTFSYNTEILRNQVLPRLEQLGKNLTGTSNKLNAIAVPDGCETVKTIPSSINNSAKQVCPAYNQIVDFIIQVESIEKQNNDLIKRTFDDFGDFAKMTEGKDGQLTSKDLLSERDYDFETRYYWGEAFNSVTNLEEGKIVKDLNNGKQIVWRNEGASKFSNTGDYFILTGYSDGKVTIENPNDNTTQEVDLSKLASYGGAFYSYGLKDYSEEAETTLPDLKYITEDDFAPVGKKSVSNATEKQYVNDYDPENFPEKTLYDSNGTLYFYQNGKCVKETWCQDSLQYSYDLKLLILELGYDPGYWIRADGVQMCGNDVMYAVNIEHWNGENPSNSTYKRGDDWIGTSGPGKVVGLCGASEWAAQGINSSLFVNWENGDIATVTYDTYVAWLDQGENQHNYYSKNEETATRNILSNPPIDTSERYYQTNEGWDKFFRNNPGFLPDGTKIGETNWEEYFKAKDPERQ